MQIFFCLSMFNPSIFGLNNGTANRWWISTTSEYGEDYSWHRLPYYMRVYDDIYYVETAPYLECSIRPVCDY